MQPRCSYLICATPRSGSTLLCEALTNTGLAGRPDEYFEALKATGLPRRPGEYFTGSTQQEIIALLKDDGPAAGEVPVYSNDADYESYLTRVIQQNTTPNGVFGAKVMWGYLDEFVAHLHTIPRYRGLQLPALFNAIFPDVHYITVTRRDKVRQAVSLWKAMQTQAWKKEEGQQHTHKDLVFHFDAIEHLVQQMNEHEAAWQKFFERYGVTPFTVVYEELTNAYEEVARAILAFLNVAIPGELKFAERRMKPQADALSEAWVDQYYERKQQKESQSA